MNMKKSFSYSTVIIFLLVAAVIIMSVGYANFSSKLEINGTAKVGASSWKVEILKDTYAESTGSATVSSKDFTETTMTYEVSLTEPGDFYEFTVNVKNSGTFDASLTGITMTALSEAEAKYLTYEVYYNGTKYTASNANIENVVLNSGDTVPVKVIVKYVQPAAAADLPATEQSITLDASFSFAQKTN